MAVPAPTFLGQGARLRERGRLPVAENLHGQVSMLAATLRAAGIGPGHVVMIVSGRRSVATEAIATLTAGATYLPVTDATAPYRLERLLAEVPVHAVLADRDWLPPARVSGTVDSPLPGRVVLLRDGVRGTVPDGLAYLLPTSGTTGRPKVVMIGRDGLDRYVGRIRDEYELTPADRVYATASFAFDVWVEETLPTLATGAELVHGRGLQVSFQDFTDDLAGCGATVVNLPSSFWAGWWRHLREVGGRPPADLRLVVIGSEPADAEAARSWTAAGTVPRLVNAYGTAETTVTSLVHDVTAHGVPAGSHRVPIGRPLPGVHLRLGGDPGADADADADDDDDEILLGGDCVARGYLDPADDSRPAFLVDPDGRRWYRTGDVGVRLPDGSIAFQGRQDHQVKVRGVRLELGDVEAAAAAAGGVRQAVAVAVPTADGSTALELFCEMTPGQAGDEASLRAELVRRLPPQAVPRRVSFLERLPLLDSGKPDRQALGRAAGARPPVGAPLQGSLRLERSLFQEVLGVPADGAADFFRSGGHSLAALVLLSRHQAATDKRVSLQEFVAAPTPAGLAAAAGTGVDPYAIGPEDGCAGDEGPLSAGQEAVWMHVRSDPRSLTYNSQSSLTFDGPVDPHRLARAVERLGRLHPVLRTTFHDDGGLPHQRIHQSGGPRLEVVDLTDGDIDAVALRARVLATTFRIGRLPLARWVLVREADDRSTLLVVEHHLIHDGVSFAIMMRDLVAAYHGQALPDRPATPRYLDFCRWQQDSLRLGRFARQLDFWRSRLDRAPDTRVLVDRAARLPRRTGFAATLRVPLPADLADAARSYATDRGTTLYALLLGAFSVVVTEAAGQRELCVGAGVANRRVVGTEGTIGLFVNTVVLRLRTDPEEPVPALLDRVRDTTVAAFDHQELPFSRLVRALNPDRRTGSNPYYQVMFSFDDAPVPDLRMGGTPVRVTELQSGYAKVDLNVIAVPQVEQRLGGSVETAKRSIDVLWEYATDVLDGDEVRGLAASFERVVRLIVGGETRTGTLASEVPVLGVDGASVPAAARPGSVR